MPLTLEKRAETFLYQQVILLIREMQHAGTLRAGEKLPSLRSLANKLSVSVPTVKQAYVELEQQGVIYARPKSGYFLKACEASQIKPRKARWTRQPTTVTRQQLIEQVYAAIHQPGNLSLGVANPVAAMPAGKTLNRTMRRVMSLAGDQVLSYGAMSGFEPLRRQLAHRYLNFGMQVDPADVVITNGAQEAIGIALQAVAKPGDVIAVESPCYFGVLELIESLGMMALEVPLCADDGLCPEDVSHAIDRHPIKACVFSSSIANPLGCWLADDKKRAIVQLLEARGIPLIEDDVYGDLYFTEQRGVPAQTYSKKGLVLSCSSFSKTAAPSYRIGWILAPGFTAKVARLKRALSCSSPLLNQWTLSEFIRGGDYDRYIRQLRQVLQTNRDRMVSLVRQHFCAAVRISDPKGGAVLWIELPRHIDGNQVFQRALADRISVSPGSLFSPSNRYQHCIRLSYGLPWSRQLEEGIKTLGALCKEISRSEK